MHLLGVERQCADAGGDGSAGGGSRVRLRARLAQVGRHLKHETHC